MVSYRLGGKDPLDYVVVFKSEEGIPNGRVDFIQVIALTMDEMDSMMLWEGSKFLSLYRRYDPFGIAVLSRDIKETAFSKECLKGT
jgi:hypothetical protein